MYLRLCRLNSMRRRPIPIPFSLPRLVPYHLLSRCRFRCRRLDRRRRTGLAVQDRQVAVPAEGDAVDRHDPPVERHEREVDHLDGRPEGEVGLVAGQEAFPPPGLGRFDRVRPVYFSSFSSFLLSVFSPFFSFLRLLDCVGVVGRRVTGHDVFEKGHGAHEC